ncbi:MAG: hypothetical protein ACKPKO_41710 [Candidatus Fonsibacter sp.]
MKIDSKAIIEAHLMIIKFQLNLAAIQENDPNKILQINLIIDDIDKIINSTRKL